MKHTDKPILHQQRDQYVILTTDSGQEVEFEQIATIPLKGKLYTILLPLQPLPGLTECEGLVFVHQQIKGQDGLAIVDDEEIIDSVFEIYNQLYDQAFSK